MSAISTTVVAADLYLNPGQSAEFFPNTPTSVQSVSLSLAYYGVLVGTPNTQVTHQIANGVLTYTAGAANDIAQFDVLTDLGEIVRHRVVVREAGDRPCFKRNGQPIFPVGLFSFNCAAAISYGEKARQRLRAADILPVVGYLPPLPDNAASADAVWNSSGAMTWRSIHTVDCTAWGGPVYAEDDGTFTGEGINTLRWAAHQPWWGELLQKVAAFWLSLPCSLPLFNMARDEIDLSFGSDPNDFSPDNLAAFPALESLGEGTATNYVEGIRASEGTPVCWYAFGLSCLYGARGALHWQDEINSDCTAYSGDVSDSISSERCDLVGADRMYASVARHLDLTRPNVAFTGCLQWSDWIWWKNDRIEIWRRARIVSVQIPALAFLPILYGSMAVRGYQGERRDKRDEYDNATHDGPAKPPDAPGNTLMQYYARFEESGGYYPEAKAAGDAFVVFAEVVQDIATLLAGQQVTAKPWGPGWRVGRWESVRGTLVIAVNVSGVSDRIPANLEVQNVTKAELVDGFGRVEEQPANLPGMWLPADKCVILRA